MGASSDKVAIVGAGALGAIYGSLLFQAGPDSVCFIARGDRHERLKREGIVVNGQAFRVPVLKPEEASPVDLLLVAVKHYQLDQAIEDLRQAVGLRTSILSVMNGIDSEERIGAVYGMDKLVYGLSLGIDAVRVGNSISYRNQGRIIFGERRNETLSERVKQIGSIFDRAGIAHHTPADMIRSLWYKYMINVGVNQVSAILGYDYGKMRSVAHAQELMAAAMREVILVARSLGVDLSEADIQEFYQVLNTLDAAGKTSMLQDVEARRKTEVEMLAGTVIDLGKRQGVATPVNCRLFEELKRIEASYRVG